MRSRLLKTTVLAAVAGARWIHSRNRDLRLKIKRSLSLKCWFLGHEDWIRRTPDRLYLECFECGRETQGWVTGKTDPTDRAGGALETASAVKQKGYFASALVHSRTRSSPGSDRSITHHGGDVTIARSPPYASCAKTLAECA